MERLRAVVYNYACHPYTGVPDKGVTAEFPGFASRMIEEQLGHRSMAFFIQGAAGDITEILYKDTNQPRDCEPFGQMLGISTLKALKEISVGHSDQLSVVSDTVSLPLRTDIPILLDTLLQDEKRLLASLRSTSLNLKTFIPLYIRYSLSPDFPSYYAEQYLFEKKAGFSGLDKMDEANKKDIDKYLRNVFAIEKLTRIQEDRNQLLLRQADVKRLGGDHVSAQIMALCIGDFILVSFPGEPFSGVGLKIKESSPYPNTFVAGYSNGYLHYAPTADSYRQEGYEVMNCILAPQWQKNISGKDHGACKTVKNIGKINMEMKIPVHYGERIIELSIPQENLCFNLHRNEFRPPESEVEEIRKAIQHPIGTKRLGEIVPKDASVVILADDRTRVTPQKLIIPVILEELHRAGVENEQIKLIIAYGTHRQMTEEEIEQRFGRELMNQIAIRHHNCHHNLVVHGVTRRGTRIVVNKEVMEADFRIGVGGVLPHHPVGWSGGAKIFLPGVAGTETVNAMHLLGATEQQLGKILTPCREEMEDFATEVGLHFIVNVIQTDSGDLLKAVAGHFIDAHREAVKWGMQIFGAKFSEKADITISSAYPSDYDFTQADKGLFSAELATKTGRRHHPAFALR